MHTKVFVGNLSFKTKADELAAEFSVAGRVVSANIITRGPRSLGYGFVELESEEEAQKAVALLNKKSIDSREINVELAKPRDETKIAERRSRSDRGGRGRRGRGGRGGGRGGRGGSAPPPSNSDNNNQNQNQGQNQNQNAGDNQVHRGGFRRGSFRRGDGRGRGRGARGGRPRDFTNRTPSPTTLFVANLPFSLDDQGLGNLFKAHKVSKSHVVKNRAGRSKGFGFVEFENEADQKAALAASEKLNVEGRDLAVKIALTAPEGSRDNAAPNASSSPASTSSPSGSATSTPNDSKEAKAPETK